MIDIIGVIVANITTEHDILGLIPMQVVGFIHWRFLSSSQIHGEIQICEWLIEIETYQYAHLYYW